MSLDELRRAFRNIENHQCDVVISVNMLMEGYDHKYLSILAIFRPYRSINAFAQVVGRILRAIPDDEITAFEIDNNGLVIFHEEIGLNTMWNVFQKEVDRAKRGSIREYTFSDREYIERENSLASVNSEGAFISNKDSYLDDIDFNELFERKRAEINALVSENINKIIQSGVDLPLDVLENLKDSLVEREIREAAKLIDPELIEKRPAQARKMMRQILSTRIQDEVANLLIENGIDEKGSELYHVFNRCIPNLKTTDVNDGIVVRFINSKLSKIYGAVKDRDNKTLLKSIGALAGILEEVKRVIR
ncbi:helicase [Photorhabdus laumondii]|nr:helicase [Photorhabdus laumondii]